MHDVNHTMGMILRAYLSEVLSKYRKITMSQTRTGRIYKIICSKSNDVYVGSTFNVLKARMQGHKIAFKRGEMLGGYPQFMEHGWESLKMILISEYQVVDRKHLLMYETLWMNKLQACNINLAFQILKRKHPLMGNARELKKQKKDQQREEIARRNCEIIEMMAHDKPQKPSDIDAFCLKENKIIYKQYWADRSKVMRKYVSGKVPRGAKPLLEIEKHTIVGKMLNDRGYLTIQQVIDHDKQMLETAQ
jgi:hypothetical protein